MGGPRAGGRESVIRVRVRVRVRGAESRTSTSWCDAVRAVHATCQRGLGPGETRHEHVSRDDWACMRVVLCAGGIDTRYTIQCGPGYSAHSTTMPIPDS